MRLDEIAYEFEAGLTVRWCLVDHYAPGYLVQIKYQGKITSFKYQKQPSIINARKLAEKHLQSVTS